MQDIPSACKTLTPLLGSAAASAFLISLLASGISSSAVGTMAGQVIMQGFVGFSIPLWVRRVVTMLPTFIIVALGNQKIEETVDANKDYFHLWKDHVLFTWQWWIQLALAIIPIVVRILLRKRESTGRLLYVCFFVLLVASWMDFVGNSFGLWYYPYKLVPTLPPFFPWETFITVQILLLLQYKPTFSPWLNAIALGLVDAFVGEPLAKWTGLYIPVHWRYVYSLPIYIVVYMIAHFIAFSDSFKRLEERSSYTHLK